MSGYLWKSYFEDDVVTFRAVLESAGYSARAAASKSVGGGHDIDGLDYECASPPRATAKHAAGRQSIPPGLVLTRADLNHRDSQGRTLLHLIASSSDPSAILFARALLEHPLTDIYLQDNESGWTALHRAFYAGNSSIALMILTRDCGDSRAPGTVSLHQGGLVKIKDHEGNGPFDVLEETLDDAHRSGSDYFIRQPEYDERPSDWIDPPSGQRSHNKNWLGPWEHTGGDEVYTFGSNKNMTLGFGDEDDRHFPERVVLKRPEHLMEKYLLKSQERAGSDQRTFLSQFVLPKELSQVPFSIRYNPCKIQDVVMGKYSSAILTSDVSSNLHVCGHGTSGRLGLGTQETMYQFTCVEGPLEDRRVVAVALGHHHTLALCTGGDVFSWGSNAVGQLGYVLPNLPKDDGPKQLLPRQIYGTLKKETILGIAASGIHSVCFTEASIFTFGKNEGQLGITDADARSLSTQSTPRRVGGLKFSHRIRSVSAIDRATICLLDNHDVWVYANYGYSKVLFVNDPFSNHFHQATSDNDPSANCHAQESARSRLSLVIKAASGGETICALTTSGEIYSINVDKPAAGQHSSTSTTNPTKIRSALSQPQKIWGNRKSRMAARDVDVDQNGSVILATRAGGVWRRTKRAHINDASANGSNEFKAKDYKFSRIPGLTSALGVRASGFGAYAAVRKEFELYPRSRIAIQETLQNDLFHLSPFKSWESVLQESDESVHRSTVRKFSAALARRFKNGCSNPDGMFRAIFTESSKSHDVEPDLVMYTSSSNVAIPFHQFLVAACGQVLQRGLSKCWRTGAAYEDDMCMISKENGRPKLVFRGLDLLTVVNLAFFAMTGNILPIWQQQSGRMEYRLRNVKSELSRLAGALKNKNLENAFRSDSRHQPTGLEAFFSYMPVDPSLLPGTDTVIQLEDGEIRAHSVLLCQRCPFFSGLFHGRARGMWVADRMTDGAIQVDFSHVEAWIFERVLRWVYTDASDRLFEDLIAEDMDDYLDKIFDVLGLASELMIDTLVKVCQEAISKHVNVQNVGYILGSVAPYQTDGLKVDCLEYICYNLEAVLRTGQLNELDEDVLAEVDQALRRHQLKGSPFTRSGMLETELKERNPGLADRMAQERRAKIDSIIVFNKYADSYGKALSSFKAGSFRANDVLSPAKAKGKLHALGSPSPPVSPRLKSKASSEFIFDMDEDNGLSGRHARLGSSAGLASSISPSQERKSGVQREAVAPNEKFGESPETALKSGGDVEMPKRDGPWTDFSKQKASMKDIMAQANSSRKSNLSIGLAKSVSAGVVSGVPSAAKLSQKERKRLQQQAALNVAPLAGSSGANQLPWKRIETVGKGEPSSPVQTGRTTPQLTMRQTVANPGNCKGKGKAVESDRAPTQSSAHESRPPNSDSTPQKPPKSPATPRASSSGTPHIQSIRHTPLPVRVSSSPVNLSMADIQSMQQAEKIIAQGGGEKRSLADIQAEQAFQEWWDKESARVQNEGNASERRGSRQDRPRRGASRGGGKMRGRSRGASSKTPPS